MLALGILGLHICGWLYSLHCAILYKGLEEILLSTGTLGKNTKGQLCLTPCAQEIPHHHLTNWEEAFINGWMPSTLPLSFRHIPCYKECAESQD